MLPISVGNSQVNGSYKGDRLHRSPAIRSSRRRRRHLTMAITANTRQMQRMLTGVYQGVSSHQFLTGASVRAARRGASLPSSRRTRRTAPPAPPYRVVTCHAVLPKEAVLVRIPDSQPLPMGRRVNRPSFVGGVVWQGGAHPSNGPRRGRCGLRAATVRCRTPSSPAAARALQCRRARIQPAVNTVQAPAHVAPGRSAARSGQAGAGLEESPPPAGALTGEKRHCRYTAGWRDRSTWQH